MPKIINMQMEFAKANMVNNSNTFREVMSQTAIRSSDMGAPRRATDDLMVFKYFDVMTMLVDQNIVAKISISQ